jgi:hypothetical protein
MMITNPKSLRRAIRHVGLALALVPAASCVDRIVGPAGERIPERVLLQVTGAQQMASLGDSIRVAVRVLDRDGVDIEGVPFVYSVSVPGVLESLGGGIFRAIGNGSARIIVQLSADVPRTLPDGYALVRVADSVSVGVSQIAAQLAVQPFDSTFWSLGATRQLSAVLSDARGNTIPGSLASVAWQSADSTVARVDSAGRVTAVSDGTTILHGAYSALSGQVPVRVSAKIPVNKCVTYVVAGQLIQRCAAVELVVTEPTP